MNSIRNHTEPEIITRILAGDKNLYEIIVRRFNPWLYKIGRSYNYSHEDTSDLMQETFIDAYKNLAGFEGRSNFKTWIIRIMLNNCYRKKEKASFKNETHKTVNDNAIPLFADTSHATGAMVLNRELGSIIEAALSRIPFDYRIVFSLREISGLNVAETAGILNLSEANIKTRLNRAKSMLRHELEKKYSPGELFEFNLVYCDAMVENVMKHIYEL